MRSQRRGEEILRGQQAQEDRPCIVGNTTSRRTDSHQGKPLKSGWGVTGTFGCTADRQPLHGSGWCDTHLTAGRERLREEDGLM